MRNLRPSNWPEWFSRKGYLHFDNRIFEPDQVIKLVENDRAVASHGFFPFIQFNKITRRCKRVEGAVTYTTKSRPLSRAAHIDSLIFCRYAQILADKYEVAIKNLGLSDNIIAYRKFQPAKCNIHFADEAFRFIDSNKPCIAVCLDIKQFFENIDHTILKYQWKRVLNVKNLPDDHYKVMRATTRYSYVLEEELYPRLRISKRKLKKWRDGKWSGPLCNSETFRNVVRATGLIGTNSCGKGVPQGSALSAVLSNIYMLDFDESMAAYCKAINGLYLRYSDDILLVVPPASRDEVMERVRSKIAETKLELHDDAGKFQICEFGADPIMPLGSKSLQYLGFAFDGTKVRIRHQTLARYFKKMNKAVRREKYIALRSSLTKTRRQRLYRNFTHLGKSNFISYARAAEAEMEKEAIGKQIKIHWPFIHSKLSIG